MLPCVLVIIITIITITITITTATATATASVSSSSSSLPGYFSVREIDGVYWMITPDNRTSLSFGVCTVNYDTGYCPKLGYSPYERAVSAKFNNSQTAWAASAEKRLLSWGWNTLGGWCYSPQLFKLPWVMNLAFHSLNNGDWFGDDFAAAADAYARKEIAPHANDTRLVGIFTNNEVVWGTFVDRAPVIFREENVILLKYLLFNNASCSGYQRALAFLINKYSNISALNVAWNINASSFTTITQTIPFLLPSDTRTNDYNEFLSIAATSLFQITHASIRRYDSNHLILGSRYSYWELPPVVVAAEGPYVDVISYNGYVWFPGFSAAEQAWRLHHLSGGKPVLISEFSFRAFNNTSGDPNNSWNSAGWPVQTQQQRADAYVAYMKEMMNIRAVVGVHWWAWADDPPLGRFDGENGNFGVVDIHDNTYTLLTDAMTVTNNNAALWHYKSTTL